MSVRNSLLGLGALLALVAVSTFAKADIIAVSFDGPVHKINDGTGVGVLVGSSGFSRLNSLARDSSGTFYSVGGLLDNTLITINPTTGVGTSVATLSVRDIRALAFSPTDVLYAFVFIGFSVPEKLYTIDVTAGSVTVP